jgi:glycosyltransferase involved in cell wall biosynthesis
MAEKSIEVIIPVRNMADHLPKVLRPLLAQQADGDVITIVNDASTDDTEPAARSLAPNVVTLTRSQGPFYARQVAACRSAADILLFVDARCRPLPGLLDAHRELQRRPGVALSCTDVRTLSGPSLAARVAALQQPFSIRKVGISGLPDFYPTANLGIDRTVFEKVGGFRAMRNGDDADICWRIQEQSLGTMAVDTRVLMEWEPRTTMRELASQWKRYGVSTAYAKWVYGNYSSSRYGADKSFATKLRAELRDRLRGRPTEVVARAAIDCVYLFGYWSQKPKSAHFTMPVPYDVSSAAPRRYPHDTGLGISSGSGSE